MGCKMHSFDAQGYLKKKSKTIFDAIDWRLRARMGDEALDRAICRAANLLRPHLKGIEFFAVAGSAYLVEPVPPCSGLADVWRHVLQKRPHQTLAVMTVLLRQIIAITRQLACQDDCHGAIDIRNVVLAPTGCFGVLAAHMLCEGGRLWLRRDCRRPARSDLHGLVEILGSLLDIDTEVAAIQKMPEQVPMNIHRKIRDLLHALHQAQLSSLRQAQS